MGIDRSRHGRARGSGLLLAALLICMTVAACGTGAVGAGLRVSYDEFRQQVEDGNVESIRLRGQEIQGILKTPAAHSDPGEADVYYSEFVTYLPSFGDDRLLPLLDAHDVRLVTEPDSSGSAWSIFLGLMPFLIISAIGYMLFARMQQRQPQGNAPVSQSQAKLYDHVREKTTFADVAGASGAKTELQEIITFLKDPSRFERLGAKTPKGVLLIGPPGTGKTLLARAVAGEASVPFYSISGSHFMELYVGVGAARVRDLYDTAKRTAPSIIFIDELDSIGRRRDASGIGGAHDEREQTLNQLLSEMDGFEATTNVIVMAATNRPDILDPALLRPGRFDRTVTIGLPTRKDREEILRIHARNKPLAEDVNLDEIARGTPGFSGADLANLLNESALLAARLNKDVIDAGDVEAARDKVILGLRHENMALTGEECSLLAYHEGGHSLVAAILPHADPIHKVTIVPRGKAMGVTQQLPERDSYLYEKEYLLDRLAVMMGGRGAENLVFGTITTGAESDLKEATRLARKMVVDWGMSERLGHMTPGGEDTYLGDQYGAQAYSDATARMIDQEVRSILEQAYNKAFQVLQEHRTALDRIADALIEREEIPGSEVVEIARGHSAEPSVTPDAKPTTSKRACGIAPATQEV